VLWINTREVQHKTHKIALTFEMKDCATSDAWSLYHDPFRDESGRHGVPVEMVGKTAEMNYPAILNSTFPISESIP
jgi:hypothetical protein